MPSTSRAPASSRRRSSCRARLRSLESSSEIQRGSAGSSGWLGFDLDGFAGGSGAAAAGLAGAVALPAAGRATSDDFAGSDERAVSMAAFASVSDRNGPRTSGRPRSSVCSASVTDHVPDAVSIVNRPSRVCQPTPASRFRDASSSVAAFAAFSGFAFGLTPTG